MLSDIVLVVLLGLLAYLAGILTGLYQARIEIRRSFVPKPKRVYARGGRRW